MSKVLDKYLKLVGLLPRGDSGGGGGGGDGYPMYEVLNMDSVPLVKDPDAPYQCIASIDLGSQVGEGDLLLIEIGGDANVTLTGYMSGFGQIFYYPSVIETNNGYNLYPELSYNHVAFGCDEAEISFIPNISMKITRLGDSSGQQPWDEASA